MAKLSKSTAQQLDEKGWSVQDVRRNSDGSLSFSGSRPIFQTFLAEGYWDDGFDDDDERVLAEAEDSF